MQLNLSRLDYTAILLAALLSAACLARGLVHDTSLGVMLCFALPLLWFSFSPKHVMHPLYAKIGIGFIGLFIVWMLLQLLFIDSLNISAWRASAGRVLFIAAVSITALQVASEKSASRTFLVSLLGLSIIMVSISFSWHRANPSINPGYYSHGLVNPNNAATYLGVMLIVCITQINSFVRRHVEWNGQPLSKRIEKMHFTTLAKILLLLFGCFLFLAGLFLTGSRGGVFLTLLVCIPLTLLLAFKQLVSHSINQGRPLIFLMVAVSAILMVGWAFSQHGGELEKDVATQGMDSDNRPSLFAAIAPMITDQPLLGNGLGSFASDFQAYRSSALPVEGIYDKAHSSYLELAAEMGIPILLVTLCIAGILAFRFYKTIRQPNRHYGLPCAGLAIITLVGTHSIFDFPMQIPAIFALVISILIVFAVRSDQDFVIENSSSNSK